MDHFRIAMQLIIAYHGGPEDYADNQAHLKVARPESCPCCHQSTAMRALGYYRRWVSTCGIRKIIQIRVRRFRCQSCQRTTSLLPDFAHTYRLVETDVVSRHFSEAELGGGEGHWAVLLGEYLRRFEKKLPETRMILPQVFGVAETPNCAGEAWEELCRFFGSARQLVRTLANDLGVTVFGVYQCHQRSRVGKAHTSAVFSRQRSPP